MTSERLGQTVHGFSEGGGGLAISRWLVRASGGDAEHNTGIILDDGQVPIQWDSTPERDDIGHFDDFGDPALTGVFPFFVEGDYHIDLYAEIDATSAFTGGYMLVSIETGGSLVNASQSGAVFTGTTPRAAVSDTYHFAGGYFGTVEFHVKLYGVGDSATVTRASVTITKLN